MSFALALLLHVVGLNDVSGQDVGQLRTSLQHSNDFRVRAQAALALGRMPKNSTTVEVLGKALNDKHFAVRAAVLSSLERLGGSRAEQLMRVALRDESPTVRQKAREALMQLGAQTPTPMVTFPSRSHGSSSGAHTWIILGNVKGNTQTMSSALTQPFRDRLTSRLAQIEDVTLLGSGMATRVSKKEQRIRLDGRIVKVSSQLKGKELMVRCEVSLMVVDHTSSALKAMVKGAATGKGLKENLPSGVQEQRLALVALDAAVDSAVEQTARALPSLYR